jgi:hypothetical protein
VKTSSWWLKPDSCQMNQHRTHRLTADSCQMYTSWDPTVGTATASFAFLATRITTIRTNFQLFLHCGNGAVVGAVTKHSVFCCTCYVFFLCFPVKVFCIYFVSIYTLMLSNLWKAL